VESSCALCIACPPSRLTKLRSPRASLWGIWGNQNFDQIARRRHGQTSRCDDVATIRARMEELRREREGAEDTAKPKASAQMPVRVNRIGKVAIAITRLGGEAGSTERAPAGPYPLAESDRAGGAVLAHDDKGDRRGVSHSRSTSALALSRASSPGAAVTSLASVCASILRNTTASGTRGLSIWGVFHFWFL
jgi:hypothetical protein